MCRPLLLKSLVSASSEASFGERCRILHTAFDRHHELASEHAHVREGVGGQPVNELKHRTLQQNQKLYRNAIVTNSTNQSLQQHSRREERIPQQKTAKTACLSPVAPPLQQQVKQQQDKQQQVTGAG